MHHAPETGRVDLGLGLSQKPGRDVAHIRRLQLVVLSVHAVDPHVVESVDHCLEIKTHGAEPVDQLLVVSVIPVSRSVKHTHTVHTAIPVYAGLTCPSLQRACFWPAGLVREATRPWHHHCLLLCVSGVLRHREQPILEPPVQTLSGDGAASWRLLRLAGPWVLAC